MKRLAALLLLLTLLLTACGTPPAPQGSAASQSAASAPSSSVPPAAPPDSSQPEDAPQNEPYALPEGGEELALLLLGEGGPLQHVALHEVNAAALALGGADGDAGGRETVHIPVDGPDGDLQLLRELLRRHPPMLQQEIYHLKEPFPRHILTPLRKIRTPSIPQPTSPVHPLFPTG